MKKRRPANGKHTRTNRRASRPQSARKETRHNGHDTKSPFRLHLDHNHLPEPEWKFPNAKIETYAVDSTPDFPPVREAPKGSPNVLLVLLDDVGFGWSSACGGLVR